MIHRSYAKCESCGQNYTFRVSIGHAALQEHTIACKTCNEDISIIYSLNQQKGEIEKIEHKNMTVNNEEGIIVNLHPEFVLDKELENVDRIFPNIIYMSKKLKQMKNFPSNLSQDELDEVGRKIHAVFFLHDEWKYINKIWSLYNRDKNDICNNYILDNKNFIHEYEDGISPDSIIFSFLMRCLAPNFNEKVESGLSCLGETLKNNNELCKEFKVYFRNEIFKQNMKRIHAVLRDFFLNYSEYSQTFLSGKNLEEINDTHSYASVNFEKTKMFYGSAYECLGSSAITLAAINNIAKGRKYDKFQNMDLAKYISLDKSGKGNCIKDVSEINWIFDFYFPQLRNGTYHGTAELDIDTHIMSYIPGKKQEKKELPYFEYLNNCVKIMLSCCFVGIVDIFLFDYYSKIDMR